MLRAVILVSSLILAAPVCADTRLLMVEDAGCPYCAQFRAEILPGYTAHAQGKAAPLDHVDIDGPYPNNLAIGRRPQVTPTFILLDDGAEVARIEGYPGREAFWPMLTDMLGQLPR